MTPNIMVKKIVSIPIPVVMIEIQVTVEMKNGMRRMESRIPRILARSPTSKASQTNRLVMVLRVTPFVRRSPTSRRRIEYETSFSVMPM